MSKKLNVLLGLSEHLGGSFTKILAEYVAYFQKSQGAFKGINKTYAQQPDTVDDPTKRETKLVATTVDEKIQWFSENTSQYINTLFAVERTNSSGKAVANLTVDGVDFGDLTSLELLRLKNIVESLKPMYEIIPTRSDSEIWDVATHAAFARSGVFQSPLIEGDNKTTTKEDYILPDPNISQMKDTAKYVPHVSQKTTTVILGHYTVQSFSGEYTHRQRAEILARRGRLLTAITQALKVANEVEAEESPLSAEALFSYLHTGK